MININLLPYPEELKEAKAKSEFVIFFVSVLILCLGLFFFQRSRGSIVARLQGEVSNLNASLDKLKDVDQIHTAITEEKNKIKARLDAINAVTRVRRNPIRHLDEITGIIPPGVWLSKFTLYASDVSMDCKSMSYYDVSKYYNNIKDSKYFEIDKFPSISEGEKFGDRPIYLFSLSCKAKGLDIEESSPPTEGVAKEKGETPSKEALKNL